MTTKPGSGGHPIQPGPKLHGFFRFLAILLGTGALTFGTIGVFFVERDWGPIALLVVGGLLVLVGMAGRIPSLKWQDNEVTWPGDEAAAKAVVEALESGNSEEQEQKLTRLSSIAPAVSAAILRTLGFGSRMWGSLEEAVPSLVALQPGVEMGKWRPDAILENAGVKIPVEIRTGTADLDTLVQSLKHARELDDRVFAGLLLLDGEPDAKTRKKLQGAGWRVFDASELDVDPADVGRLRAEIHALFNEAGAPLPPGA